MKYSKYTLSIATTFFILGLVMLLSGSIIDSYVVLVLLVVPLSFLSRIETKNKLVEMFLFYGFAFAIYHLDTNLFLAKFTGADTLLLQEGFLHGLGVFLTHFAALFVSCGALLICNPNYLETLPNIEIQKNNPINQTE
ncbi:MAG: hypothetical protein ACI870_000209 [Crocinitomicaceae bacterium]|jgi:hypothetical protein